MDFISSLLSHVVAIKSYATFTLIGIVLVFLPINVLVDFERGFDCLHNYTDSIMEKKISWVPTQHYLLI